MERIWLKSYPAGVPADIDPSKYRSLIELFDASIAKYRDRPGVPQHGQDASPSTSSTSARATSAPGCRRAASPKARAWRS